MTEPSQEKQNGAKRTQREIMLKAEKLRAEAERRNGTRFTERNLRIIDAYNSEMRRAGMNKMAALGAVSG